MSHPSPLGSGPVATVHTGVHAGKPVALKVFPAKLDRRTLAAVARERAKLATLAESAPILVADAILVQGGRHALRMELCADSLAARIRRAGPLAADDVVELGYGLARALAAAHDAGIAHGGVSPDNVLFRESGEPVLADFGVPLREAFPRDPLHAIEYVAPETLRTGAASERADLYAFGAVLHFALTGEPPHPGQLGEQPGERVLRVLRDPVPTITRPGVPTGLSTLVGRLLAADADNRPRNARWVGYRLTTMLAERPTEPAPRRAPAAPPSPIRRRSTVAGGIALTTTVAGLIVLSTGDHLAQVPGSPRAVASAAPAPIRVELAGLTDLGDRVALTWTSERILDFAVVVTPDGGPSRSLLADRNHSMTIPVDPTRKYCFRIRATDGDQIYESQPRALRGASCGR